MSTRPLFDDRHAGGVALAHALAGRAAPDATLVLGMARGGVAVAAPIARALGARLDAVVGRKLGVPGIEEVAFGAITEWDAPAVFDSVRDFIGLPRSVMSSIEGRERAEVVRRVQQYRDGQPLSGITGKTVIVVDDGLASGTTLLATARALRRLRPQRLIAAVPVASPDGVQQVASAFDDVVALATPDPFGTVSDWYRDYTPVDDAQVRSLLGRAPLDTPEPGLVTSDQEQDVTIPTLESTSDAAMVGDFGAPRDACGLIIMAHGGGSSRGSYRNRYLAARLRFAGWATLRVDLLTPRERDADANGEMRFDIERITGRLLAATRWCREEQRPGHERVVLFGASTGAAAAMEVAAAAPRDVAAVVARGGRIDLAMSSLAQVRAPSLLIVGDADTETLRQNRDCVPRLGGRVRLQTIRGAGHTFEEPGALGRVGELVTTWLARQHRWERLRRWWPGTNHWPSAAPKGIVALERA